MTPYEQKLDFAQKVIEKYNSVVPEMEHIKFENFCKNLKNRLGGINDSALMICSDDDLIQYCSLPVLVARKIGKEFRTNIKDREETHRTEFIFRIGKKELRDLSPYTSELHNKCSEIFEKNKDFYKPFQHSEEDY